MASSPASRRRPWTIPRTNTASCATSSTSRAARYSGQATPTCSATVIVPGAGTQITPMADAEAIVIGPGHTGLVAAFRLARAGWRVAVLERASQIGGAIRTENVTLPGFRHDLSATNLSLFRSSLVYRQHQ